MKSKLVIIIILVIAVAAFAFYTLSKNSQTGTNNPVPQPKTPATKTDSAPDNTKAKVVGKNPTVAENLKVMQEDAKVKVAEPVAEGSTVSQAQLPESIKKFIVAKAETVVAKSQTYAGNKSGFHVSYSVSGTKLEDFYKQTLQLIVSNKWILVSGQQGSNATLIDATNEAYQLRITETADQAGKITVSMDAIAK